MRLMFQRLMTYRFVFQTRCHGFVKNSSNFCLLNLLILMAQLCVHISIPFDAKETIETRSLA